MDIRHSSELDKIFGRFSDKLVPNAEYIEYGKKVVNKIFELLRQKSKFGVDRVYIAGSEGKKTAVITADFDCVIFINDKVPPFKEVLDDFEDVFLLTNSLVVKNITKTPYSIQFRAGLSRDYLIDVDLLPAAILLDGAARNDDNRVAKQACQVLQRIKSSGVKNDDGHEWSSSLVESQLRFMREQSPFVHQLVRLAKFWNKTIHLDSTERLYGRSTLTELVAVYAGQKEERSNRSLLSGFREFLNIMTNLGTITIQFDWNPLEGIENSFELWNDFKSCAAQRRPRGTGAVIEPANPFNNILKNIKPTVFAKLRTFATKSMDRLRQYYQLSMIAYIPLDEIFAPQPTRLSEFSNMRMPTTLIDIGEPTKYNYLHPTMIIRNEGKVKDKMFYLKYIQDRLVTAIHSFVNSGEKSSYDVQEKLLNCFEENVRGSKENWQSTSDSHESQDVTFIIPYYDGENKRNYAMMSVKW